MNKKIAIIAACLLLLSVCLCSCVHIADTNGEEDYSLGKLTEEDIVDNADNFQAMSSNKQGMQGGATRYTTKKLSGVYTIGNVYSNNASSLIIKSSVTLESGNVRICLVQDGKIIADIPLGENMEFRTDSVNPSEQFFSARFFKRSADTAGNSDSASETVAAEFSGHIEIFSANPAAERCRRQKSNVS